MDQTQLFLQNSLAKAAGLLFQAGELLTTGPAQCCLQMEITSFMLETKKSLFLLLQEQAGKATSKGSVQSAPIAEQIGQNWTSPPETKGMNTPLPDGPAGNAGTPISPPEAFGNSSAGGTMEQINGWKLPPKASFPDSCYGNALPEPHKSSAFLSLTCSNGKKLLIAKASIANILQQDEGCLIYYNGSPENPDSVMESFSYIEKELL